MTILFIHYVLLLLLLIVLNTNHTKNRILVVKRGSCKTENGHNLRHSAAVSFHVNLSFSSPKIG